MAEKRMFAKSICETDKFYDMPVSTQNYYFHLGMNADDDGFVENAKCIKLRCKASDTDEAILALKGYIIVFDSGVKLIRHWKTNNYIRSDRYTPTICKAEKALIKLDGNEYVLKSSMPGCIPCENVGIQSGIPLVYPDKNSIDKISIEEKSESIDKSSVEENSESIDKDTDVCLFDDKCNMMQEQASKQANEPIGFYGVHKNIGLTDKQYKELTGKYSYAKQVINSLSEYKYRKGITGTVKDYDVLSEWLEKDKGRYECQYTMESFDTDEFFKAALERSYGREKAQTL